MTAISRISTHRTWVALTGVLLFTSVYLFVADRAAAPPRSELAAFFYLANVVLHLGLGVVLVLPLRNGLRAAIRSAPTPAGRAVASVSLAAFAVCILAGIYLLVVGNLRPQRPVLVAHWVSAIAAVVAAVTFLSLRLRAAGPDRGGPWVRQLTRPLPMGMALVLGVGLTAAMSLPTRQGTIVNPPWAPASMDGEGDGPHGKFWPSSNQVVGNRFFPSEYFIDSESCGTVGCHADIYQQWKESAHHFSSFNNQWYRKSVEYMQEVVGTRSSKWCGGCHDMAVLLTEKPGTGKSRMDFPIKDQDWPPEKFPEAHAGIGCAVCHSIVHVKSTMGQGDYLADYPPMHRYLESKSPFMKWAHNFLIRRAPEPHKKTFLRPFHRQETAQFCSACHKVHLDVPVNRYRWLRGFDEYDAWQQSGVSGFGARSFYYPAGPDGRPAFKQCADCHMPLVRSQDAGNTSGWVHSHRFPAANTALPYENQEPEQMAAVQKMLTDGAVTVDLFALRRPKGAPKPVSAPAHTGGAAPEPLRGASLTGEDSEGPVAAAAGPAVEETVVAPLDQPGVTLRRGEDALVDVVVRTRKIGHSFPGGTFDAFDIWLELKAVDDRGKVLLWSGKLERPDGPVDRAAHFYRAQLLDGHGNVIDKRNAWAARSRLYAHLIPPGAADTVRYRLHIPRDAGPHITLTAKLNYRKFSWENTQFAFAGRLASTGAAPSGSTDGGPNGVGVALGKTQGLVTPAWDDRPMRFDSDTSRNSGVRRPFADAVPTLPITVMAKAEVTLAVTDGKPTPAALMPKTPPADLKKLRERWNDYGIGFLLQGDFRRAVAAFQTVTRLAPDWPEGWVNVARARLLEGDPREARNVFERALALYDRKLTPMTPFLRARTQFFYAQALRELGQYDAAAQQLIEVQRVFPRDRNVLDALGRLRFLEARFDDAIREFEQTLAIDPEDLTAHYNLMLCYRGKGDLKTSQLHERLYRRFKDDETASHLQGPYKQKHPWDNNEAQPVHEHSG